MAAYLPTLPARVLALAIVFPALLPTTTALAAIVVPALVLAATNDVLISLARCSSLGRASSNLLATRFDEKL